MLLGILEKHEVHWFGSAAVNWSSNYLSNKTQCVFVDGHKPSFLEITKGVPQGSVLGPVSFTIYINNIFHIWICCWYLMQAKRNVTCFQGLTPTQDKQKITAFGGKCIDRVSCYKYLGIVLDDSLGIKLHIDKFRN